MNRRTHKEQFGLGDRIAALAEATEVYAEGLEDPDLANVYWGKSLGLWQALAILTAEDRVAQGRQFRGPAMSCGPRRPDQMSSSASTRPVPAAVASPPRRSHGV